jgi:hypothetical protein
MSFNFTKHFYAAVNVMGYKCKVIRFFTYRDKLSISQHCSTKAIYYVFHIVLIPVQFKLTL